MDFQYFANTQLSKADWERLKELCSPKLMVDNPQYIEPHKGYSQDRLEDLQDFTHLIPLKRTQFDSHLMQGGAYGYTILEHDYMVLDRNLPPGKRIETDVHELIHTNDEPETRELTKWKLAIYRTPSYY